MGNEPPFDLDPHVAFRDLESLPVLLQRGMYRVIEQKIGRADPTYDDFIRAFNIAAWSLTTAGRRSSKKTGAKSSQRGQSRLKRGTLELTPKMGKRLEEEKRKLPDTKEKLRRIAKWVEQLKTADPDRATMTFEEYRRRA
jgi:hypothetical protein